MFPPDFDTISSKLIFNTNLFHLTDIHVYTFSKHSNLVHSSQLHESYPRENNCHHTSVAEQSLSLHVFQFWFKAITQMNNNFCITG